MRKSTEQTYYSRHKAATPLLRSYREIYGEIVRSKQLGLHFFRRDFLVRYRQSFLGLTWALVLPLLSVGIFFMLFRSGIIRTSPLGVPYVIYAYYGMIVWQLFVASILTIAPVVPASKPLMSTIQVPRFACFYSPVLTALTDFGIRLSFLVFLLFLTGTHVSVWGAVFSLASLIPLFLLGLGFGFIITILNSIFRDIRNILATLLQFLMFLSPVIYPVKTHSGLFGLIAKTNPITYLMDFPRYLFFEGQISNGAIYLLAGLGSVAVLLIGIRFYYLSVSRTLEIV